MARTPSTYTSASSSWCMRNWRSLHFPSGSTNSRRSQMSGVFHSVRTTAPGVPWVPNPPGPSFHAEASNSGLNQSSAGACVV